MVTGSLDDSSITSQHSTNPLNFEVVILAEIYLFTFLIIIAVIFPGILAWHQYCLATYREIDMDTINNVRAFRA